MKNDKTIIYLESDEYHMLGKSLGKNAWHLPYIGMNVLFDKDSQYVFKIKELKGNKEEEEAYE